MEDITLVKSFLSKEDTTNDFDYLLKNINWTDTVNVVDSTDTVKINRKVSYVADTAVDYKYAKFYFKGEVWNDVLLRIKEKLEAHTNVKFNSVLLNMYADGKDEIKWHSDKEETLGTNPIIACINLGATRKFWFREFGAEKEKFFYEVSDGDLLIMGENCQQKYLHAILKEKDVNSPRISLTFRFNF